MNTSADLKGRAISAAFSCGFLTLIFTFTSIVAPFAIFAIVDRINDYDSPIGEGFVLMCLSALTFTVGIASAAACWSPIWSARFAPNPKLPKIMFIRYTAAFVGTAFTCSAAFATIFVRQSIWYLFLGIGLTISLAVATRNAYMLLSAGLTGYKAVQD